MTPGRYHHRAIERLGGAAALWLVINIASDVFGVLWAIADIALLANLDGLAPGVVEAWQMFALIGLVQVAFYIIAVVIVGKWIYRASANTHASIRRLDTSPPWAVGWFFVPIANLWKPFQAMAEIARTNLTSAHNLPLGPWWALWIASNIAGNISFQLSKSDDPQMLMLSSGCAGASSLAGIGAAVLLRRIILRITAAQTAHRQAEIF